MNLYCSVIYSGLFKHWAGVITSRKNTSFTILNLECFLFKTKEQQLFPLQLEYNNMQWISNVYTSLLKKIMMHIFIAISLDNLTPNLTIQLKI